VDGGRHTRTLAEQVFDASDTPQRPETRIRKPRPVAFGQELDLHAPYVRDTRAAGTGASADRAAADGQPTTVTVVDAICS
jgi:hypothetical protein